MRNTLGEREYDKFVDSPTRSEKSAVEVVGEFTFDKTGLATDDKQDEQTALLTSIDNKVSTSEQQDEQTDELGFIKAELIELNTNNFSTLSEQQNQSTILNSIYARLLLILNAILGVLNIRPLTFLTDKVDVSNSSISVSNFPASQNVVVTSSALPSGASTSALQTAGNSILSNILSAIAGVLNIRNLVFATDKVDVSGSSITATILGITKNRTYGAAIQGFTFATAATDIFTISGVTGKKIKIKHITIGGVQQNISSLIVSIVKRSTDNIGGTSVILTNVPFNSDFSASNAVVRYYTANPTTLGTLIGIVQAERVIVGAANGNNTSDDDLILKFGDDDSSEIVLNNSNEILAINMNGVTASQNLMNIDIVFMETDV